MEHRTFTEDFKRDVVKRALATGAVKTAIAKDAGISNNLLHRWINKMSDKENFQPMPGTRQRRARGSKASADQEQQTAAPTSAAETEQQAPKKTGRPRGSRNKAKAQAAAPAAQEKPRSRIGRPRGSRNKKSLAREEQQRTPVATTAANTATPSATSGVNNTQELRAQLAAARAERDVLKKLLAFYTTQSGGAAAASV